MASCRWKVIFFFCLILSVSCAPALQTVSMEPAPSKPVAPPPPEPKPLPPPRPAEPPPSLRALKKPETGLAARYPDPSPLQVFRETEEPLPQEGNQESANGEGETRKPEDILEEALNFCQAAQDFWQKGEPENALEALDKAYELILSAEPGDDPALNQQKEDLRFMISKRILEVYASRHIAANGKNNGIPLEVNRHVQAEIDSFSIGKEKDFFIESYRRSGRFRPFILEAFREAGLPAELSWMPLIESGFKVNAFSPARALGLWQFIPSTGYKFGLKRNTFVDERLDPIKSTEAAIAYLKELHQIFGDWTTVMAAYNCGEHRVLRVIREQNLNYLDNFWDLYERLPRETARYVPRFLATLHMVNHPQRYGLDTVPLEPPLSFETTSLFKQVHLRDVAEKIGVEESVMKSLNPELRYQIVPPTRYTLRVPPGKGEALNAVIDAVSSAQPPRPEYISHRIRKGETLSGIARRYHVSLKSLSEVNRIGRFGRITAGDVLKIPQKGGIVYSPAAKEAAPPPETLAHVVRAGDSLWALAKKYGTTIEEIRNLNGLTGTQLSTGQVLKVSGRAESDTAVGGLRTYKVRKGDTPFKIAIRFNMSLEQFLRVNRLTPKSRIYPDQTLFIQ